MNRRELDSKKKSKNFKTSLENIMYDIVKETKRRDRFYKGNKRKQGKEKKSKTTSDEGFDEIEGKYIDSDTSTVDSLNLNEPIYKTNNKNKNSYKFKNPFQGYLFKEDIETLKKTLESEKEKTNEIYGKFESAEEPLIDPKESKENGESKMDEDEESAKDKNKIDCDCYDKDERKQKSLEDETLTFIKAKEEFKRQMNFTGMIYR